MSNFPPGPALTAVVRKGSAGEWLPVNYVATALSLLARERALSDRTRDIAKQLGIAFHEQTPKGAKP